MEVCKAYSFSDIAELIYNVEYDGKSQFHGSCPVCENGDEDGHHLYVFNPGEDKPPLLWCVKCEAPYEDLLAALDDEAFDPFINKRPTEGRHRNRKHRKKCRYVGKDGEEVVEYFDKRIVVENYDHIYKNPDGTICYLKLRKKMNDGSKEFFFHYVNEDGKEVWAKPPNAPVLYNLDRMNSASNDTISTIPMK